MTGLLRVATDGGCRPNPGPGGWAWAAEDGRYAAGASARTTNNIMELTAMLEVLRAFPDTPLVIEYDSQYAANCLTLWGPNWRRRGDRTKKNLDLVFAGLDLLDARTAPVNWEWVKGHHAENAHPLNTTADALAERMALLGYNHTETGVTEIIQ